MFHLLFLLSASLFSLFASATIHNYSFDTEELYPLIKPYKEDYLQVSKKHSLYYALFGNPDGVPVIVIHGGPGAGSYHGSINAFNLEDYHVVMFDQRGAMHSEPFGNMEDNTPQHAVADIEKLRNHLGIDKWIVFGGSYGSFLSILYGETHPERVLGFVLRGIFNGRKHDYENLFYGMKNFFPEAWQEMVDLIPKDERHNLITAMDKQVMNPDPAIHMPLSQAFMHYDNLCAKVCTNPGNVSKKMEDKHALSISRAFIHYAANHFFVKDNQLLDNIDRIAHIPAIIVHGRYDLICLPQNAYDLHNAWKNADLWFIYNAGHSSLEPPIAKALKVAMNRMKDLV